jgi:hypothetical protein
MRITAGLFKSSRQKHVREGARMRGPRTGQDCRFREFAALELTVQITLELDNARNQRNKPKKSGQPLRAIRVNAE